MKQDVLKNKVRKISLKLFTAKVVHNPEIIKQGKIEEPVPIIGKNGDIESWFIGITIKKKLISFMQLDTHLKLVRYSTFQRHPPSIDGCPDAATWLDTGYIKQLAGTKASTGDILAEPFLTYDTIPEKIVWAVKATQANGEVKVIYVVNDYVYIRTGSPDEMT